MLPNCRINVTFRPTTTGSRSGQFTVSSNAAGSPHTVSLSGTGTVPVVSLNPNKLVFGNQRVGTRSAPRTVTLTNSGTAPLTITSITATGDFAKASTTCGATLAAGTRCSINVTFRPTTTGRRTGQLTVSSNALGSPHKADLSGTGTVPTYLLTIRKTGNGSGTVTSSPSGINCGGDCSESYVSGKVVKLTAKPSSNSVFVGWSGACSGTASSCTVTMTQARTVTAAFVKKGYYLLTVSKAGSGSGTVSSNPAGINCGSDCDHSYRSGATVKLTAKARFDSVFAGWKGACSGRSSTCQVTLSKTQAVTATFNRRGATAADAFEEFLNLPESSGDADSAVNFFPWETDR